MNRFAELLDEAGLPRFDDCHYHADSDMLQFSWAHGYSIWMDLSHDDEIEPIDEDERAAILGAPIPWPASL